MDIVQLEYWNDNDHLVHENCPLYCPWTQWTLSSQFLGFSQKTLYRVMHSESRARKLYTSARIYEWKLGKGEWKFPIARRQVE